MSQQAAPSTINHAMTIASGATRTIQRCGRIAIDQYGGYSFTCSRQRSGNTETG